MTMVLHFKNAARDHLNFSLESHQWWLIIIIVMCIKKYIQNEYRYSGHHHHHYQGKPDSTFRYEIIEIWVHFTNGAAWGASSSSWIGAHLSLQIKIVNNIIIIIIIIILISSVIDRCPTVSQDHSKMIVIINVMNTFHQNTGTHLE